MNDARVTYDYNNLYGLKSDVAMMHRHIHHELDNYVVDMSPELQSVLKDLEKDLRKASKELDKISCK